MADIFSELLAKKSERSKTIDVSRREDTILNEYKTLIKELSKQWGKPRFSGVKGDVPTTIYDFRRLYGDYGRSWMFTWWETEDNVLVAMLTIHDASTIILLEYEVADKHLLLGKK